MLVDRRLVATARRRLAVSEVGPGGRPLLLVHGFHGARADFEAHLPRLAERGWHAVAVDQPGHGESEQPTEESAYAFAELADDLLALADALGWQRFALLGTSMGGMVAQEVALRAPDRLTALVLQATHHGPLLELDAEGARAAAHLVREQGMAALADALAAQPEDPLETPSSRRLRERPGWTEFMDAKLRACSAHMTAAMYEQFFQTGERLDRLRALAIPTLVLWGEEEQLFGPACERLAGAVPGARRVVLADAGHSPQHENPDAWLAAVTDFLASTSGEGD